MITITIHILPGAVQTRCVRFHTFTLSHFHTCRSSADSSWELAGVSAWRKGCGGVGERPRLYEQVFHLDGDDNDPYDETGETVSGECDDGLGNDRYQGGQGERPKEANTQKKSRMM